MSNVNTYMGFDGFVWFQGVVEDRLDPMKLGRVRVRILGLHTEQKEKIPTEDLPWAYPIQPITSAAISGIGEVPTGPVEGTWVVGFFRDGASCQEPVIFGTISGIPQEYSYPTSQRIGFLDPRENLSTRPRKIKEKTYPNNGDGAILTEETPTQETGESYPRKINPFGPVVGESDINRLARNEKISDTIVKNKRDNLDKNIPNADGTTWEEPTTPYFSSYPYNKVIESESGHIIEIDDTVGTERLHLYHRSGTFTEIYPDGIKVEKIVGNNYKIVLEEQYEHIQNRYNLTIDGPFNILVQNNCKFIVTGDMDLEVGGNLNTKVGGDYNLNVVGETNVSSKGDVNIKSNDSVLVGSKETVFLKSKVVASNPPIYQSFQSVIASGLSIVKPEQPDPQSVSVSSPNNASLDRNYPKEIPIYSGIMEVFSPIEDNFDITLSPEISEYRQQLIDAGIIETPPNPEDIPSENKVEVVQESKIVEIPSCSGFSYPDKTYARELDGIQMSNNYVLGELYDKKHRIMPQKGLSVNRILCNIKNASENILEPLVAYYGKNKMIISSGFRNLGSPNSPTSVHPTGEAFDVIFKSSYSSRSDKENFHFDIANEIISKKIVPAFDQIILECPGSYGPWLHIAFVSTSLGGPSGRQRGDVRTWFGGSYLQGLIKR